ncbi:hypothetical protein BD408DRAFT_122086 [Parasitella parasitica]|nr:hypothetical protein BD408DRAFT_122086 [Parasitella parasitica]
MDQPQSQPTFPIWAIAIIAVVAVVLIAVSVLCMKKRRSRSLSVDTTHNQDEKKILQTLITQKQKLFNPKSEASLPPTQTIQKTTTTTTTTTTVTPQPNEKTDKVASNIDESDYPPPEPAQEIKFSLPLPPPSTSFFSDKMELGGDITEDFYDIYLSNKKKQENDFVSIDVGTPSFYANVQQKAATIKSTLRQSMRVKQKSGKNSAQHLFLDDNQTRNSGEDNNVIVPLKEDSSKVIIDMDPPPSLEAARTSLPLPAQIPEINIITHSTTSPSVYSDYDGSPITPNPNLQEPVKAAKRVIRSASKKTKTRSMAVADPFDLPEENDDNSVGKVSRHSSVRYASIRGPKNNGEHMTLTSGSMRRLVRESVLFDEDALPVPSSTAMATTTSSSTASSAKKSVVDIADWWEAPKTNADTQNVNENHLPLNITSGLDSTSSNAPTQYRASLSASIFAGTISKASGSNASLLSDAKDESSNNSNGGVSRHSSFRRGTLGRNTLRTITASATSGMNRSLKGLFDYSSSTSLSNKVIPDDSQKMELDSDPTVELVVDERATVTDQAYTSSRQKAIPASTSSNLRSAVPIPYLKPSESSTKYALADDEEFDNEKYISSKAAEMTQQQPSPSPKEQHEIPAGSNKVEAVPSSIAALAEDSFANDSTPNSPSNATAHKGEVDTIRRMLQDTWITNMKESASNYSMLSEAESVATTSTQSTFSSKISPRQQQSLLSKSLLTQQVAKRASLLARQNGEEDFLPIQGPEPSASFSSSTVKTMVATNEPVATSGSISSEPIAIRQNAISKANGSNKVQESSFEDKPVVVTSRFSTSPMTITSAVSSPRNSSADSSRGHSRKSSAGNSTATALRISSGYSVNAKTWNGRAPRKTSRASVTPQEMISPGDSVGRSNSVNKKFFSTMRKGQKTRGNIPWMMMEEELTEKTPAQIERDRYLESGNNL